MQKRKSIPLETQLTEPIFISSYQKKQLAKQAKIDSLSEAGISNFDSVEESMYIGNLLDVIEDSRPKLSLIDKIYKKNLPYNHSSRNRVGILGEIFVDSWVKKFTEKVKLPKNVFFDSNGDRNYGTGRVFYQNKSLRGNQEFEIDNIYSFQGLSAFVEVKTSSLNSSTSYRSINTKFDTYLEKQNEFFKDTSGILLFFRGNCRNPSFLPESQRLNIGFKDECSYIREKVYDTK
jgi:hypothetical protein